MTHLQILQTDHPSGFIDLGIGNPDTSTLPLELLKVSAEAYFASGDRRSLQYGREQGDGYFRQALSSFLSSAYGAPVDPRQLFVTSGASAALDLICTLYTQPGDLILVEEPSYFLALRIFEDHGLRALPIPMDEEGLRMDFLEERLSDVIPKLLYTIPTFQNPSGVTLSHRRREELIELAWRHNLIIVADEVYQFLNYSQTPPPPFAAYTVNTDQVISVNSFSKILAPGLRLGWIQAHEKVVKRLSGSGLLDSGGGMNPFTSAQVRHLIESGDLEENILKLRAEYANRLQAMEAALRQHLPEAKWTLPRGGFFFWVRLPGVDAEVLRRRAEGFKVGLRHGALFSSQNGMRDHFRLGFSFYDAEEIEEGVKRLSDCLRSSNDLSEAGTG